MLVVVPDRVGVFRNEDDVFAVGDHVDRHGPRLTFPSAYCTLLGRSRGCLGGLAAWRKHYWGGVSKG